MSRAGLALALLISIYAVLLYAPLFFKASEYLRGHVQTRPQDDEVTAREIIDGAGAKASSDFIHLNLLPVLARVRKG